MNDITINNSKVVINYPTHLRPKEKRFKKMLHIGKLRFYVTWNFRLKNSQARDQERGNSGIVKVKANLWKRHEGRCQICGKKIGRFSDSQLHHILAWWRFPQYETDERNLMLLCTECHKHIHTDPFAETRLITAKAQELGVELKDYYDV